MDRGKEFQAEVQAALKNEYGLTRKVITTQNPQANAIMERVHKTLHNLIRATDINNKDDLSIEFGWRGILSAVRCAVNATVHTTHQATATQQIGRAHV